MDGCMDGCMMAAGSLYRGGSQAFTSMVLCCFLVDFRD